MLKINLYFTDLQPRANVGFRIPLISGNIYPDLCRENGYTAKLVDFNRLVITSPYNTTEEYAVSFELNGTSSLEAMKRNDKQNIRFWQTAEGVVIAKLNRMVRHINRHTW